jgi:hypothetical protein
VELVKKIARMPCLGGAACSNNNSQPQAPVKIKHIDILGAGSTAAKPAAKKATAAPQPATTPKN